MRFHDDVVDGARCLWSWGVRRGRQHGLEAPPSPGRKKLLRKAERRGQSQESRWQGGGLGPRGGILLGCLGVLMPLPEAGGSEDCGVHPEKAELGVL